MKIQDITSLLETIAPVAYQETYDNSGLITGNPEWICTGVIISLDTTEDVVQEALAKKCNLIVSHHPIIFEGLKKITGKNYIERTIIAAIKNNIAIYAIHTNLDNVKDGVNKKIAEKLQLQHIEILQPAKSLLKKLITFAPVDKAAGVRQALFNAGGGSVGKYSECSFNTEGTGTFKAGEGTDPFVGEIGKQHQEKEIKIELIFQAYLERTIISALKEAHPYEVVAYDILTLGNSLSEVGSGITGELKNELGEGDAPKTGFSIWIKNRKAHPFIRKKYKESGIMWRSRVFFITGSYCKRFRYIYYF